MWKKTTGLLFLVTLLLISWILIRPDRKCKVDAMLLREGDFPTGTILNEVRSPIAEMPYQSAGFSASYGDSAIYHEVSRFPWVASAVKEFEGGKRRASVQTEYVGPWETPLALSQVNSIFQDYHLACGAIISKYQCRMIGRYDEYYVFFFAYISDKGVTFDILNDLLQKIDVRMVQCLKK